MSEQGYPEVKEVKIKENPNLQDYDIYEEVVYFSQEKIGSRWVITRKENQDGQKKESKARLQRRVLSSSWQWLLQ